MSTPVLSPYAARGRSSYRAPTTRGDDSLRLTTGLPSTPTPFTACGWFVLRDASGTAWQALLALEDSVSNSSNQIVLGHDGAGNLGGYFAPSVVTFGTDYPADVPFFMAVANGSAGCIGYARRYWERTFQTVSTSQVSGWTPAMFSVCGNSWADESENANAWNVRAWTRQLTAEELLRESYATFPDPKSLFGWWPLEGNLNQLVLDFSGNGRHLSLRGTASRAERFFLPASVLVPLVDDGAVNAAAGGGATVDVTRGQLSLSGSQVAVSLGFSVTRSALSLRGNAVGFGTGIAIGRGAMALSGRTLTTAFVSAIARGRLDLSGRQIGIAYTLSVAPSRLALTGRAASFATTLDVRPSSVVLTGRDVGLQATGTTTLDVVRGSLRLTGRDVGVLPQQDVILNVTRGALALTGRPLSAAIVQAVTRGSLTLAGRTLAVDLTNTLPITRSALQFAGRDVGIFVGANVDVAVDRGTLALSGRAPLLASQINVARGSAALTGRTVSMAVVGSFQLSIDRGALSIGGRTLALEIEVPAAIAPVDATTIGPRRRGRLYPNIRFEPVRRRKDDPPELVEASVPGAGLGSRPPRQGPTAPGTGLRARGPAVAPAQQPTAPVPLPRAPQPPRRGRAAPAPTPAAPLALDVLPGHLTLPGPQEAFEQRVAAGYPSAAEIAALVHAEFEQAHLANEQRQREERRRARNQAAIDLAVKTLLGE